MRGSVYFHKELQFPNGEKGTKLLVQVNTPSKNDPHLLVRTTSQQKSRPQTPGCIPHLSLFYIEAGKPFFDVNTWIQLDHIYEFDSAYMIERGLQKDVREIGMIPKQKMNEIANCFKRIDDVSEYQLELIQKSREA